MCAPLVAPASAPAAEDGRLARLGRHLLESPQLLDDPGGARTRLDELGITLQLFTQQFLGWKAPGGGADTSGRFGASGSYDLFALIDAEELVGWPGLDFLLHVKGQYDDGLNDAVGALGDPIDDADFDEPIYIDELWLQQRLLRDRLRLRLGFLEQQTSFDRNAFANSEDRQFLSAFLDNNAVVPLPNALGVVLIAAPLPWLELALGAADADNVPRDAGFDTAFDGIDGTTGHFELTLRHVFAGPAGELPGSYRLGGFVDGREKTVFGTEPVRSGRGDAGAYLSFDQWVYRERPEAWQGLGLFVRAGFADGDVNAVAWSWSLGFQYVGPLPARDADVLGFGVQQVIGSDRYRREVDPDFDSETGIELYYRIELLPWLAVTPDLQYILDPGASGADDAFVGVMRFRVIF